MARRLLTITEGRFASVKGVRRTQALLAAIPDEVAAEIKKAQAAGAAVLVSRMKAVAPVAAQDTHPGALRASIHAEPGAHDLAVKVTVDAVDERGRFYAKHVEHGHKFSDGGHAAAKPFFYPVLRVERKRIRSAVQRALRTGMKRAAARVAGIPD